ncbi:MFS transporter [Falsiroseomonas sp. E2-1-a20]|uniref:MFS transporter n=1 Tax=Falsiroseomonas sp. E2-1-a20 TaxID=3239300 RepID=UPI003F3C74DF
MEARWLALAVLTAARTSMGFQFQSLPSVAPLLIVDLGITYAEVGFLIGLYFLPGVVLALPGGLLGRRFGDKRVVVAGLALMVAGGVVAGFADSYPALATGRVMSGVGAVLLNVLMAKMITDWFAGREIVLAMAVFVNSFPIGIGLALLTLGGMAESLGWGAALHVTAIFAGAALLLVAVAYHPHPNDGRAATLALSSGGRISRGEAALASLAGAMWGIFNGALAVTFTFVPILLIEAEYTVGGAGSLVATMTWLSVASVQAGGLIAQRFGRRTLLLLSGTIAWGIGLLILPLAPPVPVLLIIGLMMGLPVGVVMSLPSEVLRPESRATGMGLFYTALYVGHFSLPPIAGWLLDLSGSPAVSLAFGGMLVLTIIPMSAVFRAFQKRPGAV